MQPRGATSTLNMKYYRRDICSILEHKHLLDCIKRRNKSWEDQGRQMLDGVHQLQHLVWEVSREKRQHTRARLAYMDGYSRGVEHLDYLEANDEYKSIIWLHTINVVEVGGGDLPGWRQQSPTLRRFQIGGFTKLPAREGVKQKIGELEAQRRTSQQQDDNPLQQVGQSKPLHQLALLHGGGGHEQLIHHFWSKGQNNKTQDHEVHARRLPDWIASAGCEFQCRSLSQTRPNWAR